MPPLLPSSSDAALPSNNGAALPSNSDAVPVRARAARSQEAAPKSVPARAPSNTARWHLGGARCWLSASSGARPQRIAPVPVHVPGACFPSSAHSPAGTCRYGRGRDGCYRGSWWRPPARLEQRRRPTRRSTVAGTGRVSASIGGSQWRRALIRKVPVLLFQPRTGRLPPLLPSGPSRAWSRAPPPFVSDLAASPLCFLAVEAPPLSSLYHSRTSGDAVNQDDGPRR